MNSRTDSKIVVWLFNKCYELPFCIPQICDILQFNCKDTGYVVYLFSPISVVLPSPDRCDC